jgi:pimeloyl-ACP methyl ester carboxylesterase
VGAPAALPRVVVVGGFATPRGALKGLAEALNRDGFDAKAVTHRGGIDCSERSYTALLEVVRRGVVASGGPVLMVGFSRGGQFARVLAARHRELVAGVVTLGTPYPPGLKPLSWSARARIAFLGLLGSAGVSGVVTLGCLGTGCCRRFWEDLRSSWPETIPLVACYAAKDRVVHWRAGIDPAAKVDVIRTGHVGLLFSGESHRRVCRHLHAMASSFAPQDPADRPRTTRERASCRPAGGAADVWTGRMDARAARSGSSSSSGW